jgi:hypothetical protein
VLEDSGYEVTRSSKPTSVNEIFCPEGLEGLCTYVLHLRPVDAASVALNSNGLRLGLRLCNT